MNPARVTDRDDLPWLIAAQRVSTCTQAAPCAPDAVQAPAQAAVVRLLPATLGVPPPATAALWQAVTPYVQRATGLLSLDDPTLHKPYARTMDLVTRQWRGTQHHVVAGSNRLTLVWTDGALTVPGAWRVYHKPLPNRQPKQDPVRAMLATAKQRDGAPRYVCVDSWYSSLDNLQAVRTYEWHVVSRLKPNRLVTPAGQGNVALSTVTIPATGRQVHLKGFGVMLVCRIVAPNGDAASWATNDLPVWAPARDEVALQAGAIESYQRGFNHCGGGERAQVRRAPAQQNHIVVAIRAVVRVEVHRLTPGSRWYGAKLGGMREAIRA